MVEAISLNQFNRLLWHIHSEHRAFDQADKKVKRVKYVYPAIDMRTNEVFTVEIHTVFTEKKIFSVVNRTEETGSLFDEIMQWLDS